MEPLWLWVVTALPNYSPLPWAVSLFQQVWNIALEPIVSRFTLGLAWRIVQFLWSAPVQTGKRIRDSVFTMCSLRAGNGSTQQHLWDIYCSALSPARPRPLALLAEGSEPSAFTEPPVAHHPAGGQLEKAWRSSQALLGKEGKVSSSSREVMWTSAVHPLPQLQKEPAPNYEPSPIHLLVFSSNPQSGGNGTAGWSTVEIICESMSAQGTCFPHPPATFSTQLSCSTILWSWQLLGMKFLPLRWRQSLGALGWNLQPFC